MKLDKIKLSGFKSFADQTTIVIKGNLTAVVGPNGCGKSNVIDAVRWVMGESSAKHLRGGNMADVIFNGSSSRKPVSVASVELIFANNEGKAGGEYAKYSSISIHRQVNRDGQSKYALNGTRCRRKDITDLFLGTGLGARSYAIIEQGTISRMVESKPDELRIHIEEAAGISKYKERRHETEIHMRHTRENIERLDDLREELEKQLSSLKRQSEKAQKFTDLKQQERQYKCELLAIRWTSHHQHSQQLESQLKAVATEHNRLFVLLRESEKSIDTKRVQQKQQQQQLAATQEDDYHVLAEVSRLQQTIKHNESRHEETMTEINRLKQQDAHATNECEQDKSQLKAITKSLRETQQQQQTCEEQLDECRSHKDAVQEDKAIWQLQWEANLSASLQCKEQAEVQRVKLSHLTHQSQQLRQRLAALQMERNALSNPDLEDEIALLDNTIELIETDREDLQQQLEGAYQQIIDQRQQLKERQNQLHQQRSELHPINGKITSLELLQQHAMGKDKKVLLQWLKTMDLAENQRLAEFLEVDTGWDTAVETVLKGYLDAICVDNMAPLFQSLQLLQEQSLTMFEKKRYEPIVQTNHKITLLSKVNAPYDLGGILAGVYCVQDIITAKEQRLQLKSHESIVTPQGDWLGRDWIKILRSTDNKTGVLQREKTLRKLKQKQMKLHDEAEGLEDNVIETERILKEAESSREQLQQRDKILGSEYSTKSVQFSVYCAKQEQQQQRLKQVSHEIEAIIVETTDIAEMIAKSENIKAHAEQLILQWTNKKHTLDQQNQALQTQLSHADLHVNEVQNKCHAVQRQIESLKATASLTAKQIERIQQQNQQSAERIMELEHKLQSTLMPLDDEKACLADCEAKKKHLAGKLQQQRSRLQETEEETTKLTKQQVQFQQQMEQQKERLDTLRFEQQESNVRQQTIAEQLAEIKADTKQVLAHLPPVAEENKWKAKVDSLAKQIGRLGSINLTAIEDYKTQSERINFLNEQRDDLMQALNILDQAINKINKESRIRFKATFDKINQGLQTKFPKLFGGGQAYLELTNQDLLEAGVNIIAQPPGKRNSSIHLLSGGEKALTAVALVFSIFDLNPAPFCLLDEVDAPLDDANIIRFSQMVEEMSETVQFLYISHNKVTMEIAKQLSGVTMKESGVSRMVSVDIDEAIEMAES